MDAVTAIKSSRKVVGELGKIRSRKEAVKAVEKILP